VRVGVRSRAVSLIQHATLMPHIVTSFVASLAPSHFSTLSHKRYDLQKKVTEYEMCVLIFFLQILCKIFLILIRIQRDIVINVRTSHVKYPLFLSDFNETLIFSADFRKKKI
jgi:hypothetical protein